MAASNNWKYRWLKDKIYYLNFSVRARIILGTEFSEHILFRRYVNLATPQILTYIISLISVVRREVVITSYFELRISHTTYLTEIAV